MASRVLFRQLQQQILINCDLFVNSKNMDIFSLAGNLINTQYRRIFDSLDKMKIVCRKFVSTHL